MKSLRFLHLLVELIPAMARCHICIELLYPLYQLFWWAEGFPRPTNIFVLELTSKLQIEHYIISTNYPLTNTDFGLWLITPSFILLATLLFNVLKKEKKGELPLMCLQKTIEHIDNLHFRNHQHIMIIHIIMQNILHPRTHCSIEYMFHKMFYGQV